MARSADRLSQWIFYLAASFIFGAVFLRTLLIYPDNPELGQALGLLLLWLLLSVGEPTISHWFPPYFLIYVVSQTALVFVLLALFAFADFFALLLTILSMQVMSRLPPRVGALWLGLCTVILALLLARVYHSQAPAFVLIYTAANIFLGSYALKTRQAQAARSQNRVLAQEVQEGNEKLQAYAAQLEGLAVARERNRLARELHDSVTQTVFSMNLTAQSALLLLERDPYQVRVQLGRLSQLAQNALSEMELLISQLRPEKIVEGGLVSVLRQHLAERWFLEGLSVSLETEGGGSLESTEEQGLFRIAQEALNNVVKHARVPCAQVRLHLAEPFWLEIEDQGIGFDLGQARNCSKVGLISMQERADEIGWGLQVFTSPGAGTCIRVQKAPAREVVP